MFCLPALRAAVFAVTAAGASLAAGAFPGVVFILDASGSMHASLGDERKIDAVKQVMNDVVPALDPEVHVGLVAYGHRQSGACGDVEVLVPAGSDDREMLLGMAGALEPRGKTPLAAAVLTAAGMLTNKDVATTLVLISDGAETCAGDPCEAVRQLKEAGVPFELDVVGLAVDPVAASQLQCLAETGGGYYYQVDNAKGLLAALHSVRDEVAAQVAVARPLEVAVQSGVGELAVSMPKSAARSLYALEVRRLSDNLSAMTFEKPRHEWSQQLTAGTYRLSAWFATPNQGDPTRTDLGVVEVRGGDTSELQLGAISFEIPETLLYGGRFERLHVEEVAIYHAGTNERVVSVLDNRSGYYNYVPKPVPAGVYDVRFRYNGAPNGSPVARNVVVRPGETTPVSLTSGLQMTESSSDLTSWRLYRYTGQTPDPTEDGGMGYGKELVIEVRPAWNTKGPLWYPYLVPPGTYDIEVEIGGRTQPLPIARGLLLDNGQFLRFEMGM